MTFEDKLHLIRLILQGREQEAADEGFCDRERTVIRTSLLLRGYLREKQPQTPEEELLADARGSRYGMTSEGKQFLERLGERNRTQSF